jgi:AcrR family transcriptional regulator
MATRDYRQVARADATERTHRAILDAMQRVFLDEGKYDLPLEAVASRAGISTRTLLRHFGSKEGLIEAGIADFDAAVERERKPPSGDVDTAIRLLVAHYERVGDAVLGMLAAADRYPLVRRLVDEGKQSHRRWCETVFAADLASLGPARRDRRAALLATVTDVYVWELLRRRYGFSRKTTQIAMRGLADHARGATP